MDHSTFFIHLKSLEKKGQVACNCLQYILQKLTNKYTYLTTVHFTFSSNHVCKWQNVKKKVQRRAIVYNIYCKNRPFTLAKIQMNAQTSIINIEFNFRLILNQFTHFCIHKILGRLIVWCKD